MNDSNIYGEFLVTPTGGGWEWFHGLEITIPDVAKWLEIFESVIAKDKVQIRVTIEGVSRDFTLKEFMERLGFEE